MQSQTRQFLEIKMSFHQGKSKHISVPEYLLFFPCWISTGAAARVLDWMGLRAALGHPPDPPSPVPGTSTSTTPQGLRLLRRRLCEELQCHQPPPHSRLCSDSHPRPGLGGDSGGQLSRAQTHGSLLTPPTLGAPAPPDPLAAAPGPRAPPVSQPSLSDPGQSPSRAVPRPAPGLAEPGSGLSSAPPAFIPSGSLPFIGNPCSKSGPDPATRGFCTTAGAGEGKTRSAGAAK